jgi:hypothetical protein
MIKVTKDTKTEDLVLLQQISDTEVAKEASIELARRVMWQNIPTELMPKYVKTIHNNSFDTEKSFYVCSFGGSGSKMLQTYLANFGNTFHVHSRKPPNKLTRVGTSDFPEWFNNIEITEVCKRQSWFKQLNNINVIYIYRNPVDAIYSRFYIKRNEDCYSISIDHLTNIGAEHWNVPAVVGNMRDLWKLGEFFNNYTTPNTQRNYKIYCVNYDKFWDNISLFNSTLNLPDVKELYPIRKETKSACSMYIKELNEIYKPLIDKMEALPPISVV